MRYLYRPEDPRADEHGFVEAHLAGPRYVAGAAPSVIRDEMPETKHMVDGKIYTSKSKFRETTRAHGCIEVGNEIPTMVKPRKRIELDPRARREAIRTALYQAGYRG